MDMKAALIEAPHRQGGHSKRGYELAVLIGISFPISMENLEIRARELGIDPAVLWPWYMRKKG